MPVRVSRASSVIVHRVPPAATDRFLALQDGFARAIEAFPGYQGTDVYPPAGTGSAQWVVVIHFADPDALRAWLDSAARAELVRTVRRDIGEFEVRTMPTGFGAWFADRAGDRETDRPPGWKMVMAVVLGLFPTVMLIGLAVSPFTHPRGPAVATLIGNALSVTALQYAVMPALTRALGPWLHANASHQRAKSAAGVVLILALLIGLALLFRQITG